MNKAKLIVANWKMNFFHKQACNFCKKIISKKKQIKNNFIICPPSSLIFTLSTRFKQINFGAQDCSAVDEFGPYTGDINSKMLKDINCKYTLIGHSERRILHKENERIITSKIFSALDSRIIPILCVGEDELQRKNGNTKKILKKQLMGVFSPRNIAKSIVNNKMFSTEVIIAYEPVWAIGTGKTPAVDEISNTICFIKETLKKRGILKNIKVLYGGSVNTNNSKLFLNNINIDGLLVGGASLIFNSFFSMLKHK